MRISSSLFYQTSQANIAQAMSEAYTAQQQLSSGRSFTQPSENPIAALTVIKAEQGMRGVTQYTRNTQGAQTRLNTEESALNQMLDLVTAARDTGLAEGSANASAATKASAATAVQTILDQAVALGNTKLGNEYIFAGNQVTTVPFTQAAGVVSYNGDTGTRTAQLSANQTMVINHDGSQLLMASGVTTALQNLRDQLNANNEAGIQAATSSLNTAFDQVQTLLSQVGARSNALTNATTMQNANQVTLQAAEGDAWNADIAKSTLSLASAQAALQASLLAASKAMSINITQYL
jgi:flagellar hook-associated protein 3 FlgL